MTNTVIYKNFLLQIQVILVEQEVDEPHCDDAFLVGLRANVFLDNDEFFEGIAQFNERWLLLQ